MGAGLVIFSWLFCLGLLGGVWLLAFSVFRQGRRTGSAVVRWIGLVPLVVISLLLLLLVSAWIAVIVRFSVPRFVYSYAFGEAPAADVRDLKSKAWSFADTTDILLQFKASSNTFRKLVPAGVERVTLTEFKEALHTKGMGSPPKWWAVINEAIPAETYAGSGMRNYHTSEWILMTFDPTTETVQYYYVGID